MGVEPTVDDVLRDLLRSRGCEQELPEDLPLGPGGLGLDSIAMVELLLLCEARFSVAVAAELLAGGPLTIGRLAACIRSRVGA
jgi:acyl carrier protein